MAKICIRIIGWETIDPEKVKVYYKTWDCQCTCTLVQTSGVIKLTGDHRAYDKREIHLEVLKQLYGK